MIYRSIYLFCIYLAARLHGQAATTFGARGRREKHPLDGGNGTSIVETRMVALYMGACLHSSAQCPLSK